MELSQIANINEKKSQLGGLKIGRITENLYSQACKKVIERQNEIDDDYINEMKKRCVIGIKSDFHYLYGKIYDLRRFYDNHPGGSEILKMTAGEIDVTPLFESYHAFANRRYILNELEKYQVKNSEYISSNSMEMMYSFDDDGFYSTLTRRVRKHFGAKSENESVTNAIKADKSWIIKVFIQLFFHILFYINAFIFVRESNLTSMMFAFLAGFFLIFVGFTSMHDASHFAVGSRNKYNHLIMSIWCGWAGWHSKVWIFHHTVRHHVHTGNSILDPDIHHALPFIVKHPDTKARQVSVISKAGELCNGIFGWIITLIMFYGLFPGMFLGHTISYAAYRTGLRKFMWRMPLYKDLKGYNAPVYETALFFLNLFCQYNCGSFLISATYIVAQNIAYSMCIVADHDLVESALTNHIDVDLPKQKSSENEPQAKKPDWGEVQVRNTTDFIHDYYGIYSAIFGSINYQVIHHLYPGINHKHLPEISQILQKTCEEFNIPYTCYPNIFEAWSSFAIVVKSNMSTHEKK